MSTNIELQIDGIKRQLRDLSSWRRDMIDSYHAAIREANELYDEQALQLNTELRGLEALLPTEPVTRVTSNRARPKKEKATITVEDGFTQEEVDRYNQLLGKAHHHG